MIFKGLNITLKLLTTLDVIGSTMHSTNLKAWDLYYFLPYGYNAYINPAPTNS